MPQLFPLNWIMFFTMMIFFMFLLSNIFFLKTNNKLNKHNIYFNFYK
nr:ATP synthase F0 subunit 8 [Amblyomma marmoreum]